MDPEPATFICIVLLVLLSVFGFLLSLAYAAIRNASDKKLRDLAEDGDKKAIRVLKLSDKPSSLSNTYGVLITFSSIFFAAVAVVRFLPRFSNYLRASVIDDRLLAIILGAFVITFACALCYSIFCVVLPRKLGAEHSDRLAPALAGAMTFFKYVFIPLTAVIGFVSAVFVRLFGGNPHYDDSDVTEEDILSVVDAGEEKGVIEESQKEMINNIFEFDDLAAVDVMTHRTYIEAVEINDSIEDIVAKAIEEGYSRIPVYEEDLDNIKGILYVKDLLKYVGSAVPENFSAADLMREAMFIPESKKCGDLFSEMTEKHLQMVVVSDEYGGVAGIVTMEDLLESIVGNMQDEFDDEQEEFEQISEDIFEFDGTSAIDEISDLLDVEFPEGEYDTVAGYLMSVLGRIPDPDEHPTVEYEGYSFTVVEMDERRIVKIKAERLPEPTNEEAEE